MYFSQYPYPYSLHERMHNGTVMAVICINMGWVGGAVNLVFDQITILMTFTLFTMKSEIQGLSHLWPADQQTSTSASAGSFSCKLNLVLLYHMPLDVSWQAGRRRRWKLERGPEASLPRAASKYLAYKKVPEQLQVYGPAKERLNALKIPYWL